MSFAPRPGTANGAFLGQIPNMSMRRFTGPRDTLKAMADLALGDYGERSFLVRRFTEFLIGQVFGKDYLGEILVLRNASVQPSPTKPWVPMLRYTPDNKHVEFIRTPERMVKDIMQHGFCTADCDEYATLLAAMALTIGREVELVAMGFAPGSLTHVGVRVKEPKSGQWIWLDGVAGPREKEAASRAKELMTLSLD